MPQFASPASRNAPTITQRVPRLWRRIPSSIAYLDRNGGASAVAVAASSEKIDSVVRVLYGAVSRARVAIRRRVRRQDQSSTSAPRCIVRWLPGCQTLIARDLLIVHARGPARVVDRTTRHPRRAYRGTAHLSVPGRRGICNSCDLGLLGLCAFLDGRARLDGVGELAFQEAVLVDVAVDLALLEEIVVCPARGDPAVVDDDDLVRERDRREPVGDDQG